MPVYGVPKGGIAQGKKAGVMLQPVLRGRQDTHLHVSRYDITAPVQGRQRPGTMGMTVWLLPYTPITAAKCAIECHATAHLGQAR